MKIRIFFEKILCVVFDHEWVIYRDHRECKKCFKVEKIVRNLSLAEFFGKQRATKKEYLYLSPSVLSMVRPISKGYYKVQAGAIFQIDDKGELVVVRDEAILQEIACGEIETKVSTYQELWRRSERIKKNRF